MANEKKNDFVILGLLSHTPMTGYEIKKKIDTTMRLFWNASYGSIYPTLQKLELEGKIESIKDKNNSRIKIIYSITQEGVDSLKNWLKKPVVKDELRYETLLKLFFGSEVGPQITSQHIEAFEKKIKNELPNLKKVVELLNTLDNEEAHRYYKLTAIFGVKIYETYLEWCEEVKECLEKEKK